jgi:outer membrane protein TolC
MSQVINCKTVILSCLILISGLQTKGQTDLRALLEIAENNYPAIAARQAQAEAAKSNVALEKNTLVPSLDAAYQINYATYNNITGMNYPGQLIPISGPPSTDNFDPVPGSGASLLLKWTPITFGQRSASIEYHQKLYDKQLAAVQDEVLKVKFRVAYLFLDIASTNELIKAYEKNIERNEFNIAYAGSLVEAGLRPGVDSLQFRGELSRARTELFQLQNLLENQKLQLEVLLTTELTEDLMDDGSFFQSLPESPALPLAQDSIHHPTLTMAQLDMEASEARMKQIKRSWAPRLEFWGTTYARGSGISYDGTVDKDEGLSFSRYNYGAGLQLVFPILHLTNIKLKNAQQESITRSYENSLKQVQLALDSQETIAINDLTTSLKVASEVPFEYRAAESAFNALQTRYNEGLIDYTSLIQAQYDLLHAEASLKNAYVDSWKALLNLAVIRGDLNIFLHQIQN